jgi:UDP-3-O-[3-hydroxymyristoyl] glucosamine N-acyltransferase
MGERMSNEVSRAPISAAELAAVLGITSSCIRGSATRTVTHPAPLSTATEDALCFCSVVNEKSIAVLISTRAAVVLCPNGAYLDTLGQTGATLLVVDSPRLQYIQLVQKFFAPRPPSGIHPTAFVESSAAIAKSAYIGPFVFVGSECRIGEGSVVHAHVSLYPKTTIGQNVIIHSGSVIGADGFGYERNADGVFEKFPHLGGVTIEDDVEVGANTCIDRGTLEDTVVRQGAKIDNLVHVAHNVVIGRDAAVIAHAMIGGSTRIGAAAWVAPSACIRDGLTIGDHAVVGLASLVVKNVPDRATVMGAPARDSETYKAILAELAKLTKVQ